MGKSVLNFIHIHIHTHNFRLALWLFIFYAEATAAVVFVVVVAPMNKRIGERNHISEMQNAHSIVTIEIINAYFSLWIDTMSNASKLVQIHVFTVVQKSLWPFQKITSFSPDLSNLYKNICSFSIRSLVLIKIHCIWKHQMLLNIWNKLQFAAILILHIK